MAGFKITVEIPLLLSFFALLLTGSIIMNLNVYKTCYVLLDYPEEMCSKLGRDKDNATQVLESLVQPEATFVATLTMMIPNSVPGFISLVIGSWSDKYGRKPALLFVLGCITLSTTLTSLIFLNINSSPYMILVGALPTMLCGGPMTMFTLVLAYMNDISTSETRALRMAVFEVLNIFCSCFGMLLGTPLLYATSYSAVFGLSASFLGLATIYTYFFIPESLPQKSTDKPTLSTVFTCEHVTKLFRVITKKRPHKRRSIILILITTIILLGFVTGGETNVKTFYLRKTLTWSLSDFNIFTSWSSVAIMIGTIALTIILQKKLKIRETVLILLSVGGHTISIVLYALAKNNWYIYGSVPPLVIGGLVNPMLRTKLGQIVAAEEMGKTFSLMNIVVNLENLLSGLVYSTLYTKTIDQHPESFCWLSLGVTEFCMLLVGLVMFIESKESKKISEEINELPISGTIKAAEE